MVSSLTYHPQSSTNFRDGHNEQWVNTLWFLDKRKISFGIERSERINKLRTNWWRANHRTLQCRKAQRSTSAAYVAGIRSTESSARLCKYQSTVCAMPSRKRHFASKPKSFFAFVVSRQRRGWPLGRSVSQTSSPVN